MEKDNVVKMPETGKSSGSAKLSEFLIKNRKVLVIVLILVIVVLVGFVVFTSVKSASVEKGLSKIEAVEYNLTKNGAAFSDSELVTAQDNALSELSSFLSKGGIVGARADMLAADIYFQKKDFSKSYDLWMTASAKVKGTYLESLCKYEAAVCAEGRGNLDDAVSLYKAVAEDKNFVDRSRAYFNLGRINESKDDYKAAKEAYDSIASLGYAGDKWADLAKSRLLQLQIDGKIE